jgi:hypothetical protein
MDPLRSGAIFRVPDTSVLRQSPAPRTFRPIEQGSPLVRPMPMKPPLPPSSAIGSTEASYAAVPYMSPEAVSNRLENIFRQSPMPRVPQCLVLSLTLQALANQLHIATAVHEPSEHLSRPYAPASPAHSPMVPGSSIAMLFPYGTTAYSLAHSVQAGFRRSRCEALALRSLLSLALLLR